MQVRGAFTRDLANSLKFGIRESNKVVDLVFTLPVNRNKWAVMRTQP
jgi:hypothetical protein